MAGFTKLPSGKFRVQVRAGGTYRAKTFELKRDAEAWAREAERQVAVGSATGYAPPPKDATLADLIDKYIEDQPKEPGRSKAYTLKMVKADPLGRVKLASLSALDMRDYVERRVKAGAGGVTLAGDLSTVSAVLKWGRHARRLDIHADLPKDARAALPYRGLNTRGVEREREPTDAELARLYAHWESNPRMVIDMPTICRFALATAMRLGEICRIQIEDINIIDRTVVIRDRKDPRNKAGNHQTVPLLSEAWDILKPIIRERSSGRVFEVDGKSASAAFTRACTALGIEDLHFHDLRHRGTADLFRRGLDIPRVALMTGHKTWAMLRRYTDIKPADVHKVIDRASMVA